VRSERGADISFFTQPGPKADMAARASDVRFRGPRGSTNVC